MAEDLLAYPKISGVLRSAPDYRDMGNGLTGTVCLIGHSDGLALNDPYHVTNIQEAINLIGGDSTSPLLRGLLQLYNMGCRDIWLVAAAPMSEYIDDLDYRLSSIMVILGLYPAGNLFPGGSQNLSTVGTFYETYHARLATTYSVLRDWDFPDFIVPLEAPYYYTGNVDFYSQLVGHCVDSFNNTGAVRHGILGTRIPNVLSVDMAVKDLSNDSRSKSLNDNGKFVSVYYGEGLVNYPQLNFSYKTALSTEVAGLMAITPLDRSITYAPLRNVVNITNRDYTPDELTSLVKARVNPIVRTTKNKRGRTYNCVVGTDNTFGASGGDFWSVAQMRLIGSVVNTVRSIGYNAIGTTNFAAFKKKVDDYLLLLMRTNTIRDYNLVIQKRLDTQGVVDVNLSLTPYFGLRDISLVIETGPGV